MRGHRGKYRLFHIVFLAYFSLFTISTLSSVLVCDQAITASDERAGVDIGMPRLLLLELIGLQITHHPDAGNSHSSFRLIVLKKRAILPAETVDKRAQVRELASIAHSVTLSESPGLEMPARGTRAMLYEWLLSFHSGISPPQLPVAFGSSIAQKDNIC